MLRSITTQDQGSPGPGGLEAELAVQKKRLVDNMRILKRARFNAHSRLERKSSLTLFTLSMFALYGVALSLYPSLFEQRFDRDTQQILTFVQIISSIFIIIVTFIEALNDYRVKGLALQKCAIEVTRLMQSLETYPIIGFRQLHWFSEQYNQAIDACPYNHEDVDYQRALAAERERKTNKTWADARFILWRVFRYNFSVYWLSVILLLAPLALFLLPT